MSTISQTLSERYNAYITRIRPWDFFMGLADYMQYVLATPSLKKVVDEQVAIRDAEFAEIERLENQSSDEFREAWKNLMAIVEKHGLDASQFTAFSSAIPAPPGRKLESIPEQFQAFEDGRISISGFHSDHLERFVFDLAANLLKAGYGEELGEYLVTVPQAAQYFTRINGPSSSDLVYGGNDHGDFIFSKTWPERFIKVRRVERERDHKAWGAFDDLLKFWQARQEFLEGSGFFETAQKVADTEYKFGGKDALEVAWAVKDLEVMEEAHDTTDESLHFLRVDDFRTRASLVAGTLLGSLPENNTPEAQMQARVRKEAFEKVRDKYWRASVDSHLKEIKEFMEQYEIEKQEREDAEVVKEKWWADGTTPSFDVETGKILLDGRECQISLAATNQQVVCKKLFELPLGTWLKEVDVVNDFYHGDKSPRALNDAVRPINKKILEIFGIREMLKYDRLHRVKVQKEIFD